MTSPCLCLFSAGSSDIHLKGLIVGSRAGRAECTRVEQEPGFHVQAPLRVLVSSGRDQETDPRSSGCIFTGILTLGLEGVFFSFFWWFSISPTVFVFPLSIIENKGLIRSEGI